MVVSKHSALSECWYWLSATPGRGVSASLGLLILVAITDFVTGYEVRLAVLYLAPIACATWSAGRRAGLVFAVLATVFWLLSFASGGFYTEHLYYFWEAGVMLLGFMAFVWLLARLRNALTNANARFIRVLDEMGVAACVQSESGGDLFYANADFRALNDASGLLLRLNSQPLPRGSRLSDRFLSGEVFDEHDSRWYLEQRGMIPWGSDGLAVLSLLSDITNLKQTEELRRQHQDMLNQAERMAAFGELAAGLAHELNQPLMAITSYSEAGMQMLQSDPMDMDALRGALERNRGQALRAAGIIDRLREFVRHREPHLGPCDIHALLDNVSELMQPRLREHGALLDVDIAVDSAVLIADHLLLVQVLTNLLQNALESMDARASDRKACIGVCMPEPGWLEFSVSDNGPGCTPEILESLGKPFFSTKAQGLGLGLSISRSLIEAHGGSMMFSQSAAGGLRAGFRLPRGDDS